MSDNNQSNSSGPSKEAPKTDQPGATPTPGQQNQGDKSAGKPAEQQK
jgi:hypothetical protein